MTTETSTTSSAPLGPWWELANSCAALAGSQVFVDWRLYFWDTEIQLLLKHVGQAGNRVICSKSSTETGLVLAAVSLRNNFAVHLW